MIGYDSERSGAVSAESRIKGELVKKGQEYVNGKRREKKVVNGRKNEITWSRNEYEKGGGGSDRKSWKQKNGQKKVYMELKKGKKGDKSGKKIIRKTNGKSGY